MIVPRNATEDSDRPARLRSAGVLVLLIVYPLLVHVAVATRAPGLIFAALAVLGLNVLAPGLVRGRVLAWAGLALVLAAAALFAWAGGGAVFLYVAPVLVALALLWLFGRTLIAGRTPLVTRFARAMRAAPLPPPVVDYTRGVTVFWTLVFVLMALANAALALFAPVALWSAFANFGNYVIVAVLFVVEWGVRRRVLGARETGDWRAYVAGLAQLDYRRLMRRP